MHWNDEAIILSARKFGESNLIVELLSAEKGLYSGLVRGGQSKTKLCIYQPGNIVAASWRARLDEQLGVVSAELTDAIAAKVIHDRTRLQVLLSITSLLRKTLPERNAYPHLYSLLKEYLERLAGHSTFLEEYVWLEIGVLKYLGYGLDISECAVTGLKEGLVYLSPNTGRAVTALGAKGYEGRLVPLPAFITRGEPANDEQLIRGLEMTEFFLNRNLFAPHHRHLPDERLRLREMLAKSAARREQEFNVA